MMRHRRGFALIDIIVWTSLSTLFLAAMATTVRTHFTIERHIKTTQQIGDARQSLLTAMRSDLVTASRVAMVPASDAASTTSLTITVGDAVVRYSVKLDQSGQGSESTVQRECNGQSREWRFRSIELAFSAVDSSPQLIEVTFEPITTTLRGAIVPQRAILLPGAR